MLFGGLFERPYYSNRLWLILELQGLLAVTARRHSKEKFSNWDTTKLRDLEGEWAEAFSSRLPYQDSARLDLQAQLRLGVTLFELDFHIDRIPTIKTCLQRVGARRYFIE